jgi:hypothetical protein
MATLFAFPRQQAFDSSGNPLPGAKLFFYETGTSSPKDTYADADFNTPHTNPVIADQYGVFQAIWLDTSTGLYRAKLTDEANVQYGVDDDIGIEETDPSVISAAVKLGDTTRVSTVTHAADPELVLTLAASTKYLFEIRFKWSCETTATQGIGLSLVTPSGASFFGSIRYSTAGGTSGSFESLMTEATSISFDPDAAGAVNFVCISGVLDIDATAGVVGLAWAQNNSSANATTVYAANSAIIATRLT